MSVSVYSLLKTLSEKQNSPSINFNEFAEYMRRYAQHHLDEAPELQLYTQNPKDALEKEIYRLSDEHKAYIVSPDTDKKSIVLVSYFIDRFAARYKDIDNNISIPFPSESDLPKHIPLDIYEKKNATDFLIELFQKSESKESALWGLEFQHDIPVLMMPSSLPVLKLLELSISKIRQMLKKEEYHDYYLKKIRISNPGKEIQSKNFFTLVTTKPEECLESLKTTGDYFYFWNQLCYFIRQDYNKVKDYTPEDMCLLQSVSITEIAISFFKNKTQVDQKRSSALSTLEQVMNKPPYYFNKDAIARFVDSKGIPLLGQYSEQDLSDFLHTATTALDKNNLPPMLVFKTENDITYFIYKNKVLPLVVRLCADARDVARDTLTKDWFEELKNFETVPAMKDQNAFNKSLEEVVRKNSPILYAILNSTFLSLVHYEARNANDPTVTQLNLFSNGKLQPYSELLMLSRQEILTDAKILLPFWYSSPLISWFAKLLLKKPAKKEKKSKNKLNQEETVIMLKDGDAEENQSTQAKSRDTTRKDEFIAAAKNVEQTLVPADSSLERELAAYAHQWNPLIDKIARADLTEDVNSLIRDYTRKILRTTKSSNFTAERIKELSESLCRTPNLQKIKEQEQLIMYVALYMVKLVKNM